MALNIYKINQVKQFKPEYILLFDLDGTLVDTDVANNSVYRYAIKEVVGEDTSALDNVKRITRKVIKEQLSITNEQFERIVDIKRRCFHYNLTLTSLLDTFFLLSKHYQKTKCYIVTSAERRRADEIINFYGLRQYVEDVICTTSVDKYENISIKLNTPADKIILFENDENAISSAIANGLYESQIINVSTTNLKTFNIHPNNFLSHCTIAFHRLYYLGYGKPQNPDFINTLKNQFGNTSSTLLQSACKELFSIVSYDIAHIYTILNCEELAIVTIPRAKSERFYQQSQQLFRSTIQLAIGRLKEKYGFNMIDGTIYLRRHTNTKTTHLSRCGTITNDGDMPYPGITRNTCYVSSDIIGKNILLIDDIYTANVNIDEDAIQSLYDAGAQNVIFYSICKTIRM